MNRYRIVCGRGRLRSALPLALTLGLLVALAPLSARTDESGDSATQSVAAKASTSANADSSLQQLDQVTVLARRDFSPGALKSDIVKTEVISAEQIERIDAQNVLQAIDFNPGISVQAECSICNVRNITLNNLAGRFTTLMIDGVPLFSSLSSSYGLDSVSARGTQEIDIARGAGASLIAPEALAGAVNIITKVPTQTEADASLEGGNQGSRVANVYLGGKLSDAWAAAFTGSYNKHNQIDSDGNGVSEYTGYERFLGGIGLFGDFGNGTHAKLRLDYAHEDRGGGAMGNDYSAIKSDTSGNPFDWSSGPHASPSADGWYAPDGSGFVPWTGGRGSLAEIIFTRRASAISTLEGSFSDQFQWRVAAGYAHNTQDSFYEETTYYGAGNQVYSELSGTYSAGESRLTAGLNYRYEDLRSHGTPALQGDSLNATLPGDVTNHGVDNYTYRTPGVFLQYYDKFLDDLLETNVSLREDHNNEFGSIWSPRLNLLLHHTPELSSRVSLGTGYRAPTSFFEQDHGVLDASYVQRDIKHAEVSDNASYALNYEKDRLTATVSYNYNKVRHYAELVTDQTDDDGNNYTLFTQARDPVVIQGVDFSGSYKILPGFSASLGGEHFNYRFTPGTLAFARPDWKLYGSLDFDRGPLDLLLRVTTTGPMDLAKFEDYADSPRYNFDGTAKPDRSPVFTVVDLKGSYALGANWSLYAGIDNLLNYTQARHDSPLFLSDDGTYDVVHIWGPFQSRYVYAGVKVSL